MNNPFAVIETLLLDMKYAPKKLTESTDQLLTVKEAAEFLSLTVSAIREYVQLDEISMITIRGYVRRSGIPGIKNFNHQYFSRQELTDWVKSGRKKTNSEIEAEAETYLKKP